MNNPELVMIAALVIGGIAYAVVIFIFTCGWDRLHSTDARNDPETKISIVVAMRNETAVIDQLIDKLLAQDYPDQLFEIILVNDHSSDNTLEKIRDHSGYSRVVLFELSGGASGKKSALDHGIRHAGGTLIVATDADCRPGRQWLNTIDTYYRKYGYRMMAGPVAMNRPSGLTASFQSLEFMSLVGSGAGAIGAGIPVLCNGANLAYEKMAFEKVKGYEGNDHIPGGDDIFLMEKFKKAFGRKSIGFVKHKAAIVYTDPPPGLIAFFNQRIRWVSKSPAYRDAFMIFTAIVVLFFNLALLISLGWATVSLPMLTAFSLAFTGKCLIDFKILWKTSGFFDQRYLMWGYPLFQAIYIFFIPLSGIFGNILPYRWTQP